MMVEEVQLLVIVVCRCRRLRRRKSSTGEETNSVMVEVGITLLREDEKGKKPRRGKVWLV
jgi:hypothetical protein